MSSIEFDLVEEGMLDFEKVQSILPEEILKKVKERENLCFGLFHSNKLRAFFVLDERQAELISVKAFCFIDAEVSRSRGYDQSLYDYLIAVSVRRFKTLSFEQTQLKPEPQAFLLSKGVSLASLSFADIPEPALPKIPQKKRRREEEPQPHYAALSLTITEPERPPLPKPRAQSIPPRSRSFESFPYRQTLSFQHHQCNLKDPYVSLIASGQKTFEGRVNTSYFKDYKVGDLVTWSSHTTSVTTQILERREYPEGFREMLKDIGHKKMLPETKSLEEALVIYQMIPGYNEKVNRFGALAFGLVRCSSSSKVSEADVHPMRR